MEGDWENPDETIVRYFLFVKLRNKGEREERIASKLKAGSAAQLYRQLRTDGFPVCEMCGDYSPDGRRCRKHAEKPTERKARQSGEAIKLPTPSAARGLFREALQKLMRYVEPKELPTDRPPIDLVEWGDSIDRLAELEEYLQGRRFVGVSVDREGPGEIQMVRRKDLSPQEWRRACYEYGQHPDQEGFLIGGESEISPEGAGQYPAPMLVELIGAYVLTDEPLEPLVEKLHPAPETVDREGLNRLIYGYENESKSNTVHVPGMRDKARQIARIVRGGVNKPNSPGELTRVDLFFAWYISEQKQKGLSYEQIHKELKGIGYTLEDVQRLGDINPPSPE